MQYAVKRLTRSDLTFFECQLRQQNAGKQKAINLNADVFVDTIFPVAREIAAGLPKQFPAPLHVYGPGMRATPHVLMRKVIAAGGSQKNWRLNGEFIYDPPEDMTRYHGLAPDDLAVFGFDGEGVPSGVYMVLLSQVEPPDAVARGLLLPYVPNVRQSMAKLTRDELGTVVDASPAGHPIRELLETERDEALEEVALGSAEGVRRLLSQPSTRRMSLDALMRARERAMATGREGEAFVDVLLRKRQGEGTLGDVTWASDTNAINPWDFEIVELSGQRVRVEVKSTRGAFNRVVHMSQAEIIAAADPAAPRTDVYRVYSLTGEGALLRMSTDVRSLAAGVIQAAQTLGAGVEPDGYSIAVDRFGAWSDVVELKPEEDLDA